MKQYDVIVIGSGSAGLRAALSAKSTGAKVLLITKRRIGSSGVSCVAVSDRMAYHVTLEYTEPEGADAWRYHADDIFNIGMRVSDYRLAAILAKNSAKSFYRLVDEGVPFVKKDGRYDQFYTDGSVYPRACYTGPDTSLQIHKTLREKFFAAGIDYIEHSTVVDLALSDGKVCGVVVRDDTAHTYSGITCAACVVAAGGGCGIYEDNVFPADMNGDGILLAYNAGAALTNLEFIQFGPASLKTKINMSGSYFRAVPRLINDKGEEFLRKYLPASFTVADMYNALFNKGASWPISNEHSTKYIDFAIYKERKSGCKVYFDYSRNPEGFNFNELGAQQQERYYAEVRNDMGDKRLSAPIHRLEEINPASIDWFMKYNIDLRKGDLIEIGECAQHFQGGIHIDEEARTSIENLFAAGECAGGQHGANRPGGSALLDSQVFGDIAGVNAAGYAVNAGQQDRGETTAAVGRRAESPCTDIRPVKIAVRKIMQRAFSVVRVEGEMLAARQELKELREKYNGFADALGIIDMALLIAESCLMRNESRGCHIRFADSGAKEPLPCGGKEYEKYLLLKKCKETTEISWHSTFTEEGSGKKTTL